MSQAKPTLTSGVDDLDEASLILYSRGFSVCVFDRRVIGLLTIDGNQIESF